MQVTDYRAIVAGGSWSWNAAVAAKAGAVVTYRFLPTADLPYTWDLDYTASSVESFTPNQRLAFRKAADAFEAVANLRFVETDGPAMIDIHAVQGSNWGGWADLAYSTADWTGRGTYVIDTSVGDFGSGNGLDTLLHEAGHAVGLEHPHEGVFTLPDWFDDRSRTVMSYDFVDAHGLRALDRAALVSIYGQPAANGWTISGDASLWSIAGTGQDDRIVGALGRNQMKGRGGDDLLAGREEADTIRGGRGDDRLFGMAGADTLRGGPGADRLFGYMGGQGGWRNDGDDLLIGGRGDDRIFGDTGSDKLVGNGGGDILRGGDGSDVLAGGNGDDRLAGGQGLDTFRFVRADRRDRDVVTDFELGWDTLDLDRLGVDIGEARAVEVGAGRSTLLRFDAVGFDLVLKGVDHSLAESFWGL